MIKIVQEPNLIEISKNWFKYRRGNDTFHLLRC